jgi:hypothetical protein
MRLKVATRPILINFPLIIAGATAIGSLSIVAYRLGYMDGQSALNSLYESTGKELIYLNSDFLNEVTARQLYIAFGMVCCAFGLWVRGYFGRTVSALSIVGIVGCYLWWRIQTLDFFRIIEATSYTRSHDPDLLNMGFFRGAGLWDFVVLAVTIILGVIHLNLLAKSLKSGSTHLSEFK